MLRGESVGIGRHGLDGSGGGRGRSVSRGSGGVRLRLRARGGDGSGSWRTRSATVVGTVSEVEACLSIRLAQVVAKASVIVTLRLHLASDSSIANVKNETSESSVGKVPADPSRSAIFSTLLGAGRTSSNNSSTPTLRWPDLRPWEEQRARGWRRRERSRAAPFGFDCWCKALSVVSSTLD